MPKSSDNKWIPPVSFYFRVVFQWGKHRITVPFMEVTGLETELQTTTIKPLGDDGGQLLATGEIKHSNLVLKRPLEPLSEELTGWMKECFSFMVGQNKIRPCLLVIFLLGADGSPLTCWVCREVFPIKWSLSPMDAQESKLSMETLTLTCKTVERKK